MIVGKCGGVPLAIMAMAGLANSSADTLQVDNALLCFDYVSLFPKDDLIDADRLIHLWNAEVLITTGDHSNPEEIGRRCFNKFIELCIFEEVKQDEDGVVRSCRVHPTMHDLACFGAKKENTMDPVPGDVHDKLLRASFDFRLCDLRRIPQSLFEKAKGLRTILFHAETRPQDPEMVKTMESTCDKIFKTFEGLQVLDLQHLGLTRVPKSIGKLKHLIHLDLSHNNIEKLPSSITKLSRLRTLKLSRCHLLKELPPGIKNLTSLETLSHFVVSTNDPMGKELNDLNKLKGHLEILNLERFQATSSKCLNKKEHLQRLTLIWDQDEDGRKPQDDEKSLKALEPHWNLSVLHVAGYKGGKFPSWLRSLNNLVKFILYGCAGCEILPPLDELRSLKTLELRMMHSLKFIAEKCGNEIEVGGIRASSSSVTTLTVQLFPSLKELKLCDCPNLGSWWKTDGSNNRRIFSCISRLWIQNCPKLTCMPLYPGLDEVLVLLDANVKPMMDTLRYQTEEGFVPLSKVKSMQIASIKQSPREENPHIRECPPLESLPQGFKHLSSLRSLTIENCPTLDLQSSSDELEGLTNLRSLIIRGIPKLKSLPRGLENLTSLREITLHGCRELTSLPESIGKLTSLGILKICECCRLGSLTEGMRELKSLHTLIIKDCPLLLPRCQRRTGDDWPQIAHIKNILVRKTPEDFGRGKLRLR